MTVRRGGNKNNNQKGEDDMSKDDNKQKDLTNEEARKILNADLEKVKVSFGTLSENPGENFLEQFMSDDKLIDMGIGSDWYVAVQRLMYQSLEAACKTVDRDKLKAYEEEAWVDLITTMVTQQIAVVEAMAGTLNDTTKEVIRQAVINYVRDDNFRQDMLEILLTLKEERDNIMEEVTGNGNNPDNHDSTVVSLVTQGKAVDLSTNKTYELKEGVTVTVGDQPDAAQPSMPEVGKHVVDDDGDVIKKIILQALKNRLESQDCSKMTLVDWIGILSELAMEQMKLSPENKDMDPEMLKVMVSAIFNHEDIKPIMQTLLDEAKKLAKPFTVKPNGVFSEMQQGIREWFPYGNRNKSVTPVVNTVGKMTPVEKEALAKAFGIKVPV